jgi:hypothetical protein
LALTSPTSGGRSVGIVRLRTEATEFVLFLFFVLLHSVDMGDVADVSYVEVYTLASFSLYTELYFEKQWDSRETLKYGRESRGTLNQ